MDFKFKLIALQIYVADNITFTFKIFNLLSDMLSILIPLYPDIWAEGRDKFSS